MDNLTDQMDENGHLALVCNEETKLHYDISEAGPGNTNISYIYDGYSFIFSAIELTVAVKIIV